jgi:cyanophycin synthetase
VVGGPGDRRDEDLILLGKIAAQVFDRIIVKEDDDTRGRARGEVADLIVKGIYQENNQARYAIILNETEALKTGLDQVSKGGLVVIFPESVSRAIAVIKERQPLPENGYKPLNNVVLESNPSVIL